MTAVVIPARGNNDGSEECDPGTVVGHDEGRRGGDAAEPSPLRDGAGGPGRAVHTGWLWVGGGAERSAHRLDGGRAVRGAGGTLMDALLWLAAVVFAAPSVALGAWLESRVYWKGGWQ